MLAREAGARGLDTEGLRTAADELTSASVVLDRSDGERTFLHNPGASAALSAADVEAALERSGARWLHIGGALVLPALDGDPLAELLRGKHASAGWPRASIRCTTPPEAGSACTHPLPHLTAICPNLTEARGISGVHRPR